MDFRVAAARRLIVAALCLSATVAAVSLAASPPAPLTAAVDDVAPGILKLYDALHAAAEPSLLEFDTAKRIAKELKAIGFEVTEHVAATGVVGILKTGAGPTVMVRAPLDGVSVPEAAPGAAKARAIHADGADALMAIVLGAGRVMAQIQGEWSGTLMLVFQPGKETGTGARAMLNAGVFDNPFPRPDFALAPQLDTTLPVGFYSYSPEAALSGLARLEIVVHGKPGADAAPQFAKDAVAVAAQIALALPAIVRREVDPIQPVTINVGAIHGGRDAIDIPGEVRLDVAVRYFDERVKTQILDTIPRICDGIAAAAGVDAVQFPTIAVREVGSFAAVRNNPGLAATASHALRELFGDVRVQQQPPRMGEDDFGEYGRGDHAPALFLFGVGAVDPPLVEKMQRAGRPGLTAEEAGRLTLRSPTFAISPAPVINTGIHGLGAMLLRLLAPKASGK